MQNFTLVLGGGGLWGAAWMTGLIAGLAEGGFDATQCELAIGTSAGSVVGAQVLGRSSLDELVRRQIDQDFQPVEPLIDPEVMKAAEDATAVLERIADPEERLRRLGQFAMQARIASEATHREAIVRARLGTDRWPDTMLKTSAVDLESGVSIYFDKSSRVELIDAVAASCAVPKIWPPVTIHGRKYMDGGVRSLCHASLASAAKKVLVVSPYSKDARPFWGPTLSDELAALQSKGTHTLAIEADAAAIEIAGHNTLDPRVRPDATRAGIRQGKREAARVLGEFD